MLSFDVTFKCNFLLLHKYILEGNVLIHACRFVRVVSTAWIIISIVYNVDLFIKY